MAKLTRYKSFQALKAKTKANPGTSAKAERLTSEFESFMSLLQANISSRRKVKTTSGK